MNQDLNEKPKKKFELKNLFSLKDPTQPLSFGNIKWVSTLIGPKSQFIWVVLILFLAWRYNVETKDARFITANLPKICDQYEAIKLNPSAPCDPFLAEKGYCKHMNQTNLPTSNPPINNSDLIIGS